MTTSLKERPQIDIESAMYDAELAARFELAERESRNLRYLLILDDMLSPLNPKRDEAAIEFAGILAETNDNPQARNDLASIAGIYFSVYGTDKQTEIIDIQTLVTRQARAQVRLLGYEPPAMPERPQPIEPSAQTESFITSQLAASSDRASTAKKLGDFSYQAGATALKALRATKESAKTTAGIIAEGVDRYVTETFKATPINEDMAGIYDQPPTDGNDNLYSAVSKITSLLEQPKTAATIAASIMTFNSLFSSAPAPFNQPAETPAASAARFDQPTIAKLAANIIQADESLFTTAAKQSIGQLAVAPKDASLEKAIVSSTEVLASAVRKTNSADKVKVTAVNSEVSSNLSAGNTDVNSEALVVSVNNKQTTASLFDTLAESNPITLIANPEDLPANAQFRLNGHNISALQASVIVGAKNEIILNAQALESATSIAQTPSNSKQASVPTISPEATTKANAEQQYTIESSVVGSLGLSTEQLSYILSQPQFHGGSMAYLAEAIVTAAKEYNVNELYIAAAAAQESTWGTSVFAKDRNNFFGIAAYDSNPNDAYQFASPTVGVQAFARLLVTRYLSATGQSYNGTTLHDIYIDYSSSHDTEANSIADIMNELSQQLPQMPENPAAAHLVSAAVNDAANWLNRGYRPQVPFAPWAPYEDARNVPEYWCADWVSAMMDQAGIPLPGTDTGKEYNWNRVADMVSAAEKGDGGYSYLPAGNTIPKPGYIAIHAYDGPNSHINIVTAVNGNTVTYVGGDQINPLVGNYSLATSAVSQYTAGIGGDSVTGYIIPPGY